MGEHVVSESFCGKCGWASIEMAGDMANNKSDKCPQCGGKLEKHEFQIDGSARDHIKECLQKLDTSRTGSDLKEGLLAFFSDRPAAKRKKSWF